MSYLIDTNIFLEILLDQANKERCKKFLQNHVEQCGISDFSLHSIGVITFRKQRENRYQEFLEDVLPALSILHLEKMDYAKVLTAHKNFELDFDDAYPFTLARSLGLTLATQDKDFRRLKNEISLEFI